MLACDTRDAWTQFLQYVKTRCSITAYGNWLSPIHVLESAPEEITLEVPNIFVKEYLLSNYKKDLCAFLPVNCRRRTGDSFHRCAILCKRIRTNNCGCSTLFRKRCVCQNPSSCRQTESKLSV